MTDIAGASFGLVGTAVGELQAEIGEQHPGVVVDRRIASGWFRLPLGPSLPLGSPLISPIPANLDFFTELPTADDRWLRLHGVFKSARARIASSLGVPEDIHQVAEIVRESKADDIEQQMVDGGAIVAASRTTDEWLESPAGRAVEAEPLAAVTDHPASGSTWRPTPQRPLTGLKVLDLTRVIAGPVGTRFLAALGAEVLRLDRPGSDESITHVGHGAEQVLGKRWAYLDLKTSEGISQFKRLLAEADVLVHGYRPGGIDELISEDERRAIKPDLIEVSARAYGWTGPWAMRRGFDTIVQFSTGLANATQSWALEDPENRVPLYINGSPVDASRPRHTAVEGLDLATGHMIAAAAIRGLTKRIRSGAGSTWKFSLARTASMVIRDARNTDPGRDIRIPIDGPWEDRIFSGPFGPTRRLIFPVAIENTPLFWERPAERVGSSSPIWTF
ncbi:CoA transferase [Arthrobacter sp. W4I7]|uniref:CoA transferase n=1 Tax=Arthrobacter sp. W4I7 TaxID=3042296 RepID=UPI0027D84E33|nr:CoA transferase [Arthrobacter sp. W4I7]